MPTPCTTPLSSHRCRAIVRFTPVQVFAPAVLLCCALIAQTPAALPVYAGQKVLSVELAGRPNLNTAPLLAKLPQKSNTPFSATQIAASEAELRRLIPGLSELDLVIRPEPAGVRVLFVLQPADYFGVFQFPGAGRFAYTRLLQAADYIRQQPYTAPDVTRASSGLTDYLHQEGYFLARISPSLALDSPHRLANVVFHVSLGPRARFGAISLAGATPAQNAYLQSALTSWFARLRRASIIYNHAYSATALRNAAQYLQSHLNSRGYLGARVTFAGARYDRSTNLAHITFDVAPGSLTTLQVVGIHLWPWTRHSILPIYTESRVSPDLIQEGADNLTDYLSAHGYFTAKVSTSVSPHAIVYRVSPGPQRDVEAIHFNGNTNFTSAALAAQLAVKPEGFFWFSHGQFNQELLRQSVASLVNLYQAAGYSSVAITPRVTHPGGNLAVAFDIHEGPRDTVARLTVTGNTAPLPRLKLHVGGPFAQTLVNDDRSQVLADYLSHGYLIAAFRATAQRQPGHPHAIDVEYAITQGPQTRVASLATAGRVHTQPRLIQQAIAPVKPESLLSESAMLRAESNLYAPGIFDWAEIAPLQPITHQTESPVVIKLHESKRNELTYGFGFDYTNRGGSIPSGTVAVPGLPVVGLPSNFTTSQASFWGPSGSLEYSRLNIAGKAETMSLGAFAGRLDQRGSFTFTNPALFWTPFASTLQFTAEHDSTNPIYTAREATASFQLALPLDSDQTSHLFLRANYNQTSLTRLLIPALVPVRDQSLHLATLSASFVRDTRDNPLDAHKGLLESYELDYTPAWLASSANFGKLLTQTAYYHQLATDHIVWANSLRFGSAHAFGSSFVPLSQEFFSGGGSTLRGFPLDGAGPQRTIPACGNPNDPSTCTLLSVPVGGNDLLILNSEFRIPTPMVMKDLGVALFYDGGNVFSHLGLSHLGANYSNTLGFGFRYQTAVGPIRIDFGHNLNAPPGVNPTQIFITLGQAF